MNTTQRTDTPNNALFHCASLEVHDKVLHSKVSLRIVDHQIRILTKRHGVMSASQARQYAAAEQRAANRLPAWCEDEQLAHERKAADLLLLAKCLDERETLKGTLQ